MPYYLNEVDTKEILLAIAKIAEDVSIEIPEQYNKNFDEPMQIRLNKPENVFLNVFIFLSIQVLTNLYSERKLVKQYLSIIRNEIGDDYYAILLDELSDLRKIYVSGVSEGYNPLDLISEAVFVKLTGRTPSMVENLFLATYLSASVNYKAAWESSVKA